MVRGYITLWLCLAVLLPYHHANGQVPAVPAVPVAPFGAGPSGEQPVLSKVHQEFLENHRSQVVPLRARTHSDQTLNPLSLKNGPRVYGFLPYWEIDYQGFQWDVLTHVAYFCATLDVSGDISDTHHWLQSSVSSLIAEAHAHNVQVVLTIVNFENEEIGVLCNDPDLRSKAIQNILALVQEAGGDGVNIDFEFVPYAAKEGFVLFMSELTEAFHEAIPGSHVSYAGPCVDWGGAYDYDALKLACDDVFVMGYCYHPHDNIPGPKAPIEGGDVWWSKHLTSTLEEYVTWGGEDVREKLIMGLPFYGYEWDVPSPGIPNTFSEKGKLIFAYSVDELAEDAPWELEPHSLSTYQEFQGPDGGWIQRWLDTAESHSYKFEFSCDEAIGGVGFWALGYDSGDSPIWDALRETLDTCPAWQGTGPIEPDAGIETDSEIVDAGEDGEEEPEEDISPADSEADSEQGIADLAPEDAEPVPDVSLDTGLDGAGGGFQVSQGDPNASGTPMGGVSSDGNGVGVEATTLSRETETGCQHGGSLPTSWLFWMLMGGLFGRMGATSRDKNSLLR